MPVRSRRFVSCFTADGSLISPAVGSHAGEAALREFARRFARFRGRGPQLRHMISNLAAAIDGERAQATCYLLVRLRGGWTSEKGRLC
jgi:hypothetical protein